MNLHIHEHGNNNQSIFRFNHNKAQTFVTIYLSSTIVTTPILKYYSVGVVKTIKDRYKKWTGVTRRGGKLNALGTVYEYIFVREI